MTMKKVLVLATAMSIASVMFLAGCESSDDTLTKEQLVQEILMDSQTAYSDQSTSRADFGGDMSMDYSEPGLTITGSLTYSMDMNTYAFTYTGDLTSVYSDYSAGQYTLNGTTIQTYTCSGEMSESSQSASMTVTIAMNGSVTATDGTTTSTVAFNNLTVDISITGESASIAVTSGNVTVDDVVVDIAGSISVEAK